MHKTFSFNNEKKEWIYTLEGLERPPFAPINRNLLNVENMNGAYLSSTQIQPLVINVPVGFKINSDISGLELKEEMSAWLFTEKPVPLVFDDEPERTYFAIVQNTMEDFQEFAKFKRGTIQFLCLDPYKYGPEQEYSIPDITMIENKGTAEADPIFELTATKKTTFAMISNGDEEYNLIGHPVDVDEVVVDTKTQLLEERGQTLGTWTTAGTQVDGGVVAGNLSTDNDGITVPSYGPDTNNWHGPALMKEVTPAQDFEVEMMVQGRTTETSQTFRIEVYLFDENMNELGKMAILDNNIGINRKKAEGRLGDYGGLGQRYLISSQNYSYNQDYWYGMLRMRRVGSEINFYVTRINNANKHVQSLSESTYINENYLGKLKFIQIHIGKYGDTDRAYAPKIDHVKVFELSQVTEDQTPYILDVGDVVEFNHKEDDILINGEPRNDLKNFGGSFFKLQKGFNSLIVTPADSFDTTVKFRDKYL